MSTNNAPESDAALPVEQPASDAVSADNWSQAMQEQASATTPAAASHTPSGSAALFQPLSPAPATGISDLNFIKDIPVQLSVELGRTRLTIQSLMQLGQGSVVELDAIAGEPMDIYVNGFLIAQGEVVVVDEKYGVRVTDILTPSERLAKLNGRR